MVGERLVHGWDIARALGVEWRIDPRDAAVAMAASIAVMPLIGDPAAAAGLDAVPEIRLRGRERYCLQFEDGTLTTTGERAPFRADCRISAARRDAARRLRPDRAVAFRRCAVR